MITDHIYLNPWVSNDSLKIRLMSYFGEDWWDNLLLLKLTNKGKDASVYLAVPKSSILVVVNVLETEYKNAIQKSFIYLKVQILQLNPNTKFNLGKTLHYHLLS